MANEAYKQWYVAGLKVLLSANKIGERTTRKLIGYTTSPQLKDMLQHGSEGAKAHVEQLQAMLDDAGDGSGEIENGIMLAIDESSDQIAGSDDADVRDAGVIASAQLALHYYIAAYGSLAATAAQLGLDEQAGTLKAMCGEIRQADEAFTELAEQHVNTAAAA